MTDVETTIENQLATLKDRLAELEHIEQRCVEAETALKNLELRNRLFSDSAPMGLLAVDRQGCIQGLNRKLRNLLPWPPDKDPIGMNLFEFQPLLDAGVIEKFRHCMTQNSTVLYDHSCVDNSGQCLQLRFHLGPVSDNDGWVTGVMAFVENATQLKKAQTAALESEQRYRLLFESAPIAMIERDASQLKAHLKHLQASGVVDLKHYLEQHPDEVLRCVGMIKTTDCNDAFLELLETTDKESLMADLPRVIMGPEFEQMVQMAREMVLVVAQGCSIPERELTIRTSQGRNKRVMMRAMALAGHETTMARVVVSMVDITARVTAEEALRASEQRFREQALHDNLTGLYNQRYLYHSLPLLIQTAGAEKSSLSVIFIDLDNFKHVVDTHGHLNGSRVIQAVAGTIAKTICIPTYAVAYAGDEFVIVMPEADADQAWRKAQEIQNQIKTTRFLEHHEKGVRLDASFGIATFPNHGEDAEALLSAADTALFGIKGTGKGAIGRYR